MTNRRLRKWKIDFKFIISIGFGSNFVENSTNNLLLRSAKIITRKPATDESISDFLVTLSQLISGDLKRISIVDNSSDFPRVDEKLMYLVFHVTREIQQ